MALNLGWSKARCISSRRRGYLRLFLPDRMWMKRHTVCEDFQLGGNGLRILDLY